MALRKEDASNCIAALSAYTTEVQLHDALCSEEENIQVLVHNVTIEQLYSAFTDTSTMFYATNDVPDMNKHGIMDNQPPANPLKAATTVWDQEMVRGSASQVETTEKATEEKLEKKWPESLRESENWEKYNTKQQTENTEIHDTHSYFIHLPWHN